MRSKLALVLALAAVLLLSPARWGQSAEDDSDQLRRLVELLEERLAGPSTAESEKKRVTQLGSGPRYWDEEPQMVVRIYDLSDLFALAPAYPATHTSDLGGAERLMFSSSSAGDFSGMGMMGGMGGMGMGGMGGMGGGMGGPSGDGAGGMGGGGMFNVDPQPSPSLRTPRHILPQMSAGSMGGFVDTPRTSIDSLIDAITTTIAPEDWDDVGGPGSIAALGNELLISASDQVHSQIEVLLDTFRKRWGTLRTVSVRTHWLWMTDAQLAGLLVPNGKPSPEADAIPAYGLVDEVAWKPLAERQPAPDQPAGYHAVLTCYNGQTVHVVAGGQSQAVVQMIPVVDGGKNGGSAYQPIVSTIQAGAALQMTPSVSVSGKYVTLDVRSRVVEVRQSPRAAGQPTDVGDSQAAVVRQMIAALDRPLVMNHRLATTLRVPVDKRMLVGGMTYSSPPQPGEPGLYLFMKASVQELRDDVTSRMMGTELGAESREAEAEPK